MCIQEHLGEYGHARNLIITTLRSDNRTPHLRENADVVVKRNRISKRFERQLLKCIDGDNNFRIERVDNEAMLAAGTLPIRAPATVHALHS